MAKICVILPDEVKEEIDKVAKEQDRNLSWVVRKAIEEYLSEQSKDKE
jgi:predicted transcriptional regulator